ncbi:hypothetical protein GB937_002766 [Aspergillus fischeri]|nr:hypothetical protein GB937_002766 [Aspergillus fischeri]
MLRYNNFPSSVLRIGSRRLAARDSIPRDRLIRKSAGKAFSAALLVISREDDGDNNKKYAKTYPRKAKSS